MPFFSPVISAYAFFLFPTFIPFTLWLFMQGGVYLLLGLCGLVYMPVIFISCYYSNKFLKNFLSLHYKNISLGSLNQLLERRVIKRTKDLEKSLAVTKSTLESSADGLLVINLRGHIEYHNKRFLSMWKLPPGFADKPDLSSFIREAMSQLKYPQDFLIQVKEVKKTPGHESCQEIVLSNDNIFEWHSRPHKLRNNLIGYVWIFRDVTTRKQMEKQLAYQATHDLLTGLPNRTLLYDRINQGIAYANRYHTLFVLFFIDIDNFKIINDNLGHNAGDIFLQKIARKLVLCTRESDTVARFGGDEFVILYIIKSEKELARLSQRILRRITKPMRLLKHEIVVTASIGASVYPIHGKDPATLLKNADMAMYLAKAGQSNIQVFDESVNELTQKKLELQMELRNALAAEEFFLLYQPTINLKTGELVGVEALVRWQHPRKGIILPLNFIPLAEESKVIVPLGEWIFAEACRQNHDWQRMGLKPIRMAINVSGIQLIQNNFVDYVRGVLHSTHLNPECIEIELTESVVMDNKMQNLHKLRQLKDLGISLTIDDFGTGYSSLNYLKEFPVDKLKIDQSFVQDCIDDHNDASIIQAIIAMGHSLRLKVLAEGIEREEQLNFLRNSQCDEGQGFFYGQPMTAEKFAKLLQENKIYPFEK
ncbi:EAL domain-containing protein [Legionella jordanis]|nr:EAL domain-containing protein [Legionella jordanis]